MHFLELESELRNYQNAKFIVIPIPYEATTSYGQGTKNGPAAILAASQKVENFDYELKLDIAAKFGIHTLKPVSLNRLQELVSRLLKDNKTPVILGGEHSITPRAVKSFTQEYKDLSVLQLDAHADLRDSYKGSKDSHACPMRRVLELCPAVQVGIRSISETEYEFAKTSGQLKKIHWANKPIQIKKVLSQLSSHVYITIDVDVFDPSVVPAVGTPEPGGLFWYQLLDILCAVGQKKKVVGFDVVELCPRPGDRASDFTVAKLVYKLMGLILKSAA